MVIIAPDDILSYVYFHIPCEKFPLCTDRSGEEPLVDQTGDIKRIMNVYPRREDQILISLNAYRPISEFEKKLRRHYSFNRIFEFRNRSMDDRKIPMLYQYLKVANLEFPVGEYRKIPLKSAEKVWAGGLVKKWRDQYDRVIAIHTDTCPEKEWTDEQWSNLIRILHQNLKCYIFALGTPHLSSCFPYFEKIESDWHKQAALLNEADGFIGIDSCWAHVADSMGKKGVVLFSKYSNWRIWGPLSDNMKAVLCHNLKTMSATEVWRKIESIIS